MLPLLAALALGAADPHAGGHADHAPPRLGTVGFESTCAAPAKARLEEAFGWLHSFEYDDAERLFEAAAAADPGCAIAHWGVAMSRYHPLWAPPSAEDLARGSQALAKARAAGFRSRREEHYVAALEAFYGDAQGRDHRTRVLAWTEAMGDLHARYPTDREAAVFYALALVAAGTLDQDPAYARETQAAAILNAVLEQAPDHPGVAHYLIHSFDYPALARFALPAARRYAGLAPASAHALHMPSHIFVRLGLWQDAAASNAASEAAAIAYARERGMAGSWDERLHAMDYLAYAWLQAGRDDEARAVVDALAGIERVDPPSFKVAFAATAIPARYALERRAWDEAAALELPRASEGLAAMARFPVMRSHLHLARAVGAARLGNARAAAVEVEALRGLEAGVRVAPGEYDWRGQVSIQRQVAEAWLAWAEGRSGAAVSLMTAAADLDDRTEKHPVTPGAVLPAREQLGELLLELDRPREARAAFEAALAQAPGRFNSLRGAALAADRAGDPAAARRFQAQLAEISSASARPDAVAARAAAGGR